MHGSCISFLSLIFNFQFPWHTPPPPKKKSGIVQKWHLLQKQLKSPSTIWKPSYNWSTESDNLSKNLGRETAATPQPLSGFYRPIMMSSVFKCSKGSIQNMSLKEV